MEPVRAVVISKSTGSLAIRSRQSFSMCAIRACFSAVVQTVA